MQPSPSHRTSAGEAARRYARRPPDLRGRTAIGAALDKAPGLLEGKQGRPVIDVSGDGPENRDVRLLRRTGAKPDSAGAKPDSGGVPINGLAMLGPDEPDLARISPQDRVVMAIEQQEDFFAALRRKLLMEMAVAETTEQPKRSC